jgi:hypothetical protein
MIPKTICEVLIPKERNGGEVSLEREISWTYRKNFNHTIPSSSLPISPSSSTPSGNFNTALPLLVVPSASNTTTLFSPLLAPFNVL